MIKAFSDEESKKSTDEAQTEDDNIVDADATIVDMDEIAEADICTTK